MRWIAPPTSRVQLASAAGTRVTLEPGGSMAAMDASATQRLALMRGTVDVHVAKLLAGERFVIDTPDVEVEVHGTSFRVSLVAEGAERCDADTTTRVTVTEGVVSVRWAGVDARLLPGDSWPANCRPAVATAPPAAEDHAHRRWKAKLRGGARAAARPGASSPVRGSASGDSPGDGRAPVAAPTTAEASARPGTLRGLDASELAAQNNLYAAAVRAKRGGRASEASRLFTDFVRRFPDSSLLESAMAQRMRLAAAARESSVAAARAREYLTRFPSGFARDEAHALVGR